MFRRFTASHAVLAAAAVIGIAIGATTGSVFAGTAHKVSMAGSKYAPAEVKARVGDTIRFDNDDFENHWVYVPTVGNYQVSRAGIKPGESFDIVARAPGKFTVLCGLHTSMETVVTVSQ
jgi:plastocyanin